MYPASQPRIQKFGGCNTGRCILHVYFKVNKKSDFFFFMKNESNLSEWFANYTMW